MKLKFNRAVSITVVENYDEENDEVYDAEEHFKKDEIIDVDIFEENDKDVSIQFGDGSIADCIPREWFTIIEE